MSLLLAVGAAPPPSGPVPAGKHRKRYGVLVAGKLLVFDSPQKAEQAKQAALALVGRLSLKRLRIAAPVPEEIVPLAEVRARAQEFNVYPAFQNFARQRDYESMLKLYDELRAKREEEEIATVLLLL